MSTVILKEGIVNSISQRFLRVSFPEEKILVEFKGEGVNTGFTFGMKVNLELSFEDVEMLDRLVSVDEDKFGNVSLEYYNKEMDCSIVFSGIGVASELKEFLRQPIHSTIGISIKGLVV